MKTMATAEESFLHASF